MYYPINWPRIVRLPEVGSPILHNVMCNRDKILIAVVSSDSLFILYNKPCVPVACWKRDTKSVEQYGENQGMEWKPDSSVIAILTSKGYLSFYDLKYQPDKPNLYDQRDSSVPGLRRESAELYTKESVPAFSLKLLQIIPIESGGTNMVCIRDELMIATKYGHILRYSWSGVQNRDYCLDLRRIPFCVDQLAARAVPITEPNTYVSQIDYSPLLGGFAIVLNDGRAAFLTATTLKFDPNQVQGIWAPLDDVTSTAINHRFRLMAFGRRNSHAEVFTIDETTGGLQLSHTLQLSSRDYPGPPGPVQLLKWTPDGCCLALCWAGGAVSLWSTFGALLLCTLNWDYGDCGAETIAQRGLSASALDWGIEGYQLWMVNSASSSTPTKCRLMQMELVKSPLTANPCMSSKERLYLHGQDRLYVNISDAQRSASPLTTAAASTSSRGEPGGALLSSKQWLIVQAPNSYMSGNWPLRFAALDAKCEHLAVAGRTGFALYSFATRRWKLFGNESQERDFVVAGGLVWWRQYLIVGCYNIGADRDEIRIYPRDSPRLDNNFSTSTQVSGQILLLSLMDDSLLVYTSDCHISLFELDSTSSNQQTINRSQEIDVSTLGLHPACLVAATLTSLSNEPHRMGRENILLNVCGRVLLIQRGEGEDGTAYYAAPTVLASSVEILWVPNAGSLCPRKPHLTQALWLCCGAAGMRVWLPLYPREGDKGQYQHAFMSKRIMLPFQLHIYPLSVLFEEAILVGVETDTLLYPSPGTGPGADWLSPLCVLERNSQVYLHHIFRQLIRRNLGFHAWEIARGCTSLPYFSHSLELLLHEVLEEEATSKEPIPDALLPSVLEFIQEFPVYLTTVVQCARKTEVALWPYLFGSGPSINPRHLFQRCLELKKLDLAASYLIILQNMEPVTVSRQYATVLLDAALELCGWDLAKDLVRFLRAIDPSDADSTTNTCWKAGSAPSPAGSLLPAKISLGSQTPPVSPGNPEDFNFLLGSTVPRPGRNPSTVSNTGMKSPVVDSHHREVIRSVSDSGKSPHSSATASGRPDAMATASSSATASTNTGANKGAIRKKSVPVNSNPITISQDDGDPTMEELFLDVILQRHVRRLLSAGRLKDLGYLAAHFDCPLVSWLGRERMRAARIDDFVSATRRLHADFDWPYPVALAVPPIGRKISRVSLEEKLKALEVDVTPSLPGFPPSLRQQPAAADSGYLSLGNGDLAHPPGLSNSYIPATSPIQNGAKLPGGGLLLQTVEAHLKPHAPTQEEWSVNSEGDQFSLAGEERLNDVDSMHELSWNAHSIAVEASTGNYEVAKVNTQSELQLRYLLQLFTEADCLDWALVLALALRDAMAVLRLVSMARSALTTPQPNSNQTNTIETVTRLRDGLLALSHWVETDCQGYRSFMNVIYGQVGTLTKLILPGGDTLRSSPEPSSPKTIESAPVFIETAKSRHTSIASQVNPLHCVNETEEVETGGTLSNGLLEQHLALADKQLASPTSSKQSPAVDQLQQEQQHQQGSSCIIS